MDCNRTRQVAGGSPPPVSCWVALWCGSRSPNIAVGLGPSGAGGSGGRAGPLCKEPAAASSPRRAAAQRERRPARRSARLGPALAAFSSRDVTAPGADPKAPWPCGRPQRAARASGPVVGAQRTPFGALASDWLPASSRGAAKGQTQSNRHQHTPDHGLESSSRPADLVGGVKPS